MKNMSNSTLASLLVELPPLAEQRRIVAILDEAFEAIATAKANAEKNLQSARELFDNYRHAVFRQIGETQPHEPLGALASFRNGINFTKQSKGSTVRIVGVKDFQDHLWTPVTNLENVTIEGPLSEADRLAVGDILSVRSNGNPALIGRCMLVGDLPEPTTHSGFTIKIRLHRADALPEYVCQFLKSPQVRRRLIEGGNGANIKSLNQGTLSEISVPVPPRTEQELVIAKISAMSEETSLLADIAVRKLAALDELKQSLLHQAFTGALTARTVDQQLAAAA